MQNKNKDNNQVQKKNNVEKFGTFGGVFTPSLLTILGVIMFLRFSTVLGYSGLYYAFLILIVSKVITLFTALSISSIATNMEVKGGGAYYLISRSLGVEFGSVIAMFFFFAQAVAVSLYVFGFTEVIFCAFPDIGISFRDVATITNILVFICVYIGASWTIRVQYFILGIMILSILSFAIGAGFNFSPEIFKANLLPRWAPGHSLFKMFALFFPAVTGIMAGVNMSGDLKDPARSIPNGTFAAIGVSALVYASLIFLLAGAVPRNELLGTGFIMKEYAAIPFLIYGGVFCATLSSALGSMMGAPRVIQAFARDRVFKWMNFLGKGSGKLGEPRRATILTFIISQICIFAGDLDSIAPIITMFFLMTYGTVNLACFYEGRTQNPSFRPTFKYNHWFFSLFGALGCLLVMFLINPLWAFIALILGGGFYLLIIRAEIQVKWGDLSAGLAFQRARNALLKLEKERYHPKNWRPSILTLSGGVYNRLHLVEYSCWLTADVGVVSVAQIILGELEKLISHRKEAETLLRKFLRKEKLPAFPIVLVENDLHSATKALIQCHGIGGMRPNTVLMGWSPEPSKSIFFKKIINTVIEMKRSLLILATKQKEDETRVSEGDINIWWTSNLNGQFMLLLAFVLRKHRKWNDCKIRIIRTVPMKADKEKMIFEMNKILVKARIEAEILILPTDNPLEILRNNIYPSALIFVGIELKDNNPQSIDYQYLQKVVAELPCDIIFAHNAGDVSLEA